MCTFNVAIAGVLAAFLEDQGVGGENIPRRIPHRRDAFEVLSERQFIQRFRLNKAAAREVVNAVSKDLSRKRFSRSVITPQLQVLMALRFFGTGGSLDTIAKDEFLNCSKGTIGKAIHVVSKFINLRLTYKVSFPYTREEKTKIKRAFHKIAKMPGCLGMIGNTDIAIMSPAPYDSDDEDDIARFNEAHYYSRNGYHALNVLIVSDHNMKIRFMDSTFPGRNHNSRVWKYCVLKSDYEIAFEHGEWLLGDSGYPLEPCLMTPARNPLDGTLAESYNQAHKKTLAVVEQCIGILKNRFRCLQRGQTLLFRPDKCSAIISTCAILHNMCVERNIEMVDEDGPENADLGADEEVPQQAAPLGKEKNTDAIYMRQQLINSFSFD